MCVLLHIFGVVATHPVTLKNLVCGANLLGIHNVSLNFEDIEL